MMRRSGFYIQPPKYLTRIHKMMLGHYFISEEFTPRTVTTRQGKRSYWHHDMQRTLCRGRVDGGQVIKGLGLIPGLASWVTLARGVTSLGLFSCL